MVDLIIIYFAIKSFFLFFGFSKSLSVRIKLFGSVLRCIIKCKTLEILFRGEILYNFPISFGMIIVIDTTN